MRRRHLWLAGGLVCGLLGCSSFGQRAPENRVSPPRQATHSVPTPTLTQNSRKPNDEPAKELQAKPSSCVTMGDFYASCATDENRADGERQRFSDEARKAYRRALQQDQKYLPAFLGLGRLADSNNEREEAIAVYNEALSHHPKEPTIWFERGVSLSRLKRFDEALASYQRAVQIDPKNKSYNMSAGYMLALMGRHDDAIAWLKRLMPESSARYSIALVLRKQGQDELGRKQLALALRAEPNHKQSLELLARWDEPSFRGTEVPLQQAQFAAPPSTQPTSTAVPTAVVIDQGHDVTQPADVPKRAAADMNEVRVPVNSEVNWTKAVTARTGAVQESAGMPLIPVLSEHWERKPTTPPALSGPRPTGTATPRPLARLGFEEQP